MIRINLLPFREQQIKRKIRNQILCFCLFLLLFFAVLVCAAVFMDKKMKDIDRKTRNITNQMILCRERADQANGIKEQLGLLEQKIAVIEQLNQKRYCQADLLADLAHKIVRDRMWIEQITTDASTLIIQGVAFDNHAVAVFMNNLESSLRYGQIHLTHSAARISSQGDTLRTFTLECQKNPAWKYKPKR